MNISSVINRYSDPMFGSRRSEAAAKESATAMLEGFGPVVESGDAKSEALRDILNKYDVTDITPREFSEMLQELRQADLISDAQFQQLNLMRGELEQASIDADDSVDLVSFYERRLAEVQLDAMFNPQGSSEGETESSEKIKVEQRLAWVQKMAAARDSADSVGLNAVA